MAALDISLENNPRAVVLHLRGALDAHTSAEAEARLNQLLREGVQAVILDFTEVEYVSSAGFGVLLGALHTYRIEGVELKIATMSERVQRVFAMLGFHRVFDTRPSVAEAIASLPESTVADETAGL
ncbi:MAG: STAS domain-containing protein [Cyanobacteria bacterium REEB65]|nr:STAS domain-containing protein [Cyanobacteria bacterium REEB65]